MRETNERLVLHTILKNPGTSRQELSGQLGLSASAISGIVERLQEQELVVEGDSAPGAGPGRPRTSLSVNPRSRLVAGVEVTPYESTLALADLEGRIVEEVSLPAQDSAEDYLEATRFGLAALLERATAPVTGVGVSIPGNLNPATGNVVQATNLGWRNVNALAILIRGIDPPVSLDNNANLSALAERWFSPVDAAWRDNFVFVTLRGGLGSGIVAAGQLVRGAQGYAGEFGHMILHPEGLLCVCGARGCWEQYGSDRALARHYTRRGGKRVSTDQIVQEARAGDGLARKAVEETAQGLGQGLANVILALNPAAVVLDDFAASSWDLVEPVLRRELRRRIAGPWLDKVQLRPSDHAAHSSLAGAFALVLSRFFVRAKTGWERG